MNSNYIFTSLYNEFNNYYNGLQISLSHYRTIVVSSSVGSHPLKIALPTVPFVFPAENQKIWFLKSLTEKYYKTQFIQNMHKWTYQIW